MEDMDRHERYLRGYLNAAEQSRYEGQICRRPELLKVLRARLESDQDWVPEQVARAGALLAVNEAFVGLPEHASGSPRLELRPRRERADELAAATSGAATSRLTQAILAETIRGGYEFVQVRRADSRAWVAAHDASGDRELMSFGAAQHAALLARLKQMAGVAPDLDDVAQHGRIPLAYGGVQFSIEATFEPGDEGEVATLVVVRL